MARWFNGLWKKKTNNQTEQKAVTPTSQTTGGSSMLGYSVVGDPVWTPRSYAHLSKEGYEQNVIVYRCVNLIARGAGSVKLSLMHGDHEVDRHPLLKLMNHPSPGQSGASFIESVMSHYLLSGNAYIEIVRDGQGKPVEMYSLRPDRVKAVPNKQGDIIAYDYKLDHGRETKRYPVDRLTGRSGILHLKLFHPLNDYYGMSPIEAAAKAIDQHNAVAGHNLALMQNGGRPSGVFIVKGGQGSQLTNEQREHLRHDIRNTYEGSANAGKIMMMEGDFEWKEMGLSPKDLDFAEGKFMAAREIAQAYGVPTMLVGVPGESTFSNYREARMHLWEDTILPLLDQLMGELNTWLLPLYGEHLRLAYDLDAIPALALKRESHWARVSQTSFLTINEKRRELGFEPIKDGDELVM